MKKILNFSTRIAVALMVALSQLFFIPLTASAVGEPEIVGGTTINGLVDVYVPITGLTVTGTTTDPVPVTLSVPQGQLSMTTTTGLTFSGSQTGASLSFTGSQANVNAALATLRYRTTRAETVQLTATMSSPGVVYFPGNGHIYEVIDHGSPLSWNDAKVAAEGLTKNGATGYLATITSQAENDYLLGKLIGDGWFGASDATTEDDWQWVTGPEAGTSFWQGLGDGSPVGGFFSNWSGGEPNNAGDEDCAQFYSNGSGWNDLPCGSPALNYYVVEYGTDGQLPVAPSNTVYTVTTTFPPAQEIPVASCLDLIDVADNSIDHRYDNLSLTSNIDCAGETIAPMFSDVDPDLGIFGFRGTFDGNGHTISNITIDENANNTGLIATTDGATIQDLSVNGSVKGGDTCVGGLVGLALNTTFNDVSVDVDVTSYNSNSYGLGGMIGCLQSHAGTSAVTDSSSTGSVTGYSSMGGMIGSIDAENGGTATITGNTATTPPASTNGYNVGGLVGEVDADDDNTTITFSDNTTGGLNLPDVYTVGGVVGNLSADNDATINLTQNTVTGDVTGGGSVGGLLGGGYAEDNGQLTISNFHYAHDITAGDSYAGGIIGEAGTEGNSNNTKLIITNSSVSGSVSGGSEVGGILGSVYWDYGVEESRISYSHVSGNVTSDSDEAGGLAGSASGLIVEHSYNTGNVEASGSAGGLIGEASDTSIGESYVTGSVVSTGDGVGGLVGKNGSDAQITESYATGAVQGFSRVGGLVGANGSGALIRDSYARGAVTGNNNTGGLAGRCGDGMIENSYATGAVTGSVTTGGLLGYNAGSCVVSNSFWDTQTTTQATSAGNATGKTTAQMKTKTTFTDTATAGLTQGWDFASVWGMNTSVNNGYACLLWQANSCGDSEDSDGVSNAIENAAPNTGDANNDSVADSQQSNVASFLNGVTQNYTVLELNAACDLTSVSSQAESNNATDDAGFVYPNGFVHFTADCGTPGYTTNVTQYYYGSVANNVEVRKYNPATQTYTKINTATVDRVTIAGQQVTRVVYQITDGGTLDEDGTANGIIVDPVGLGVVLAATTPVANNGLSGTGQNVTVGFLTAGMLMLGGAAVITYRRFRLDRR